MKIFGLVGKDIAYSFSQKYFSDKFKKENRNDCIYKNFDIPDSTYFTQIIKKNKNIKGLNVTIPYKQEIIPYLDKLSRKAEEIGAVNCIKITKKNKLKGYNTDIYGFKKSLLTLLQPHHTHALIFGTGGASKAVAYVLEKLNISYKYVSRNPQENNFSYNNLSKNVIEQHTLLINCTPTGTFPTIENAPQVNYNYLSNKHLVFDLIYNPNQTKFLKLAKENGSTTKNGYDMLVYQAEKSWEIWNNID